MLGSQRSQQLGQRKLLLPPQSRRRLVEQEQHRIGRQRARDLEQALVAERQIAGKLERPIAEADACELLQGFVPRPGFFGLVEPQRPGQEARLRPRMHAEEDIVQKRHARANLHMLEGSRDAGAGDPALRRSRDVLALKGDATLIEMQRPREQIEHRGLARAIGADQPEYLAGRQIEADVVHGDQAAEAPPRALDLQQRRSGRRFRSAIERWRCGRWALFHPRQPLRDERDDPAARMLQKNDEQHGEHDDFELARGALGDEREIVLDAVLQEGEDPGSDNGPDELGRPADHCHHEVVDADMDIERRRAHKATEMRIQPAGERGEQRGNRECDEPGAEGVDAQALDEPIASAQCPYRAAFPGLQQIARQQQGRDQNGPDQIEYLPAADERYRPDRDRRNAGDAGEVSEAVDVAEQEIDRQAPGNRAEREKVPAEPQRDGADRRGGGASQRERQDEPQPRRIALQRREPGGRVGGDPDEGRLPERHHAADAGQQHEPERGERIDTDIVQQRDAERVHVERSGREQDDERRFEDANVERAHSSTSSSVSPIARERHSKTGMRTEKTMTSLKALLQNDAKLSSRPTSTAPSAVMG